MIESKYIWRRALVAVLGAFAPSIVVFCVWVTTFGQMFTLAEALFSPAVQVFSALCTVFCLIMFIASLFEQ
jgi:hypothetical protein